MIFKIIHVVLLASVKYFFTLPYAILIGLEFEQAILAVLVGGIGGFLFFYYMSNPLVRGLKKVWAFIYKVLPKFLQTKYQIARQKNKSENRVKVFTKRKRFIVKLKTTYGFWGIIIATPIILTIPVGAVLANKYYSKRKHTIPYMIMSIVGWAGVLSGFIHIFPKVFF
ncbi:MAG: twin-arginine translocase subunit TatC [Prolixibacteraceae bacterium]|nr:twin-arginine translocase subunit TatC [Prolixibacteraceae bacterium]